MRYLLENGRESPSILRLSASRSRTCQLLLPARTQPRVASVLPASSCTYTPLSNHHAYPSRPSGMLHVGEPSSPALPQQSGIVRSASSGQNGNAPAWKTIFRIGSSKKLAGITPLTVDTEGSFYAEPATLTPNPPLTPHSIRSPDQRSSYTSSNTLSSDSNKAMPSRTPHRTPSTPAYLNDHLDTSDANPSNGAPRTRTKSKAEKPRLFGRTKAPLTADPTQSGFPTINHPSSKSGPLSPKAFGANASRFIRRVASAPNAKGLFLRPTPGTSTRNGLLSPGEPPHTVQENGLSDQGTNSLETVSSASSRGQPVRPKPHRAYSATSTNVSKAKGRVMNAQNAADGPGRVAFRRTYSSHSIKVRSVRVPMRHMDVMAL